MTDTNNKPTIQESLNDKSVKKSLLIKASLFLLFAVGVMCLTLAAIKYVDRPGDDSVLDHLPEIPPAAAKNQLLAQALAKADRDLRQMSLSDQPSQKFGQKAGQLGELYHGNDFYSEALACYEIAMEFDSQNPLWPHHVAFLKQMRGENESVVDLLKRTIELAANYIPAVLKLADVYYKMGEFGQAKIYYQQTLSLDPRNRFALLGLSRIALDSSKWQQGQHYLEKAIESDPAFGAAHRLLASVHKHFGRTELMAASLKKAEEVKRRRFPVAPDPWNEQVSLLCYDVEKLLGLGAKARQMYYIELAKRYFQRAFMFDHDDPEPFFEIGTDAFESGLKKEAKPFFEKVIRIDPSYTKAYNRLGSILLSEQKAQDAEQMFLKALQYDPENAYSYDALGGSLFQQGKYEEALRSFTRALKIDPDVKSLNYHIASSLHKLGRIDQAINYYHEQLERQPEHKDARFPLALAFLEKNQIQAAVRQYRLLLQTDPDSANVLNSLAWILATTEDPNCKDPAEAVKLANRACEITNYKIPIIVDTLAVAYAADGQFQKATETAQKALGLARASGKEVLARNIQERCELYKIHQLYRQFPDEKNEWYK